MEVNLFSVKGEKKGKVELPDNLFGEVSDNLLSQVLRFYEFNAHKLRPRRKTRADVNISTRKIYRQKGTGGARHGARSAPIFVGGGLAHGPLGLKRLLRLPQSIKRKALSASLSSKLKDNRLFLVESFSSFKKTRDAFKLIESLLSKEKLPFKGVLVVLKSEDKNKVKALSNISGVKITTWESINAYDIFQSNLLILDYGIFEEKKEKKENKSKNLIEKTK